MTLWRTRPGTALALILTIALAGCTSDGGSTAVGNDTQPPATKGSGAASSSSIPDPCTLLSASDIEAASGVAVKEGVFNTTLSRDFQSVCDWKPVTGAFPVFQVLISPGADQVASQRASAQDAMGAAVDVSIPGVHDAYAVSGGIILGMATNDYFVQVSYLTSKIGDFLPITSSLSATVVSNL